MDQCVPEKNKKIARFFFLTMYAHGGPLSRVTGIMFINFTCTSKPTYTIWLKYGSVLSEKRKLKFS